VCTLPGEIKSYLFAVIKRTSVHVTATLSNLTDFNNFCAAETEKMYKTGYAFFIYYLKKVLLMTLNVSLFAGPVYCEPTPSTSGGVICRPVSTLKTDILNITYDCYCQNNNVEMTAL